MSVFGNLWRRIRRTLSKSRRYDLTRVEDPPEHPNPGTIYVIGDAEFAWSAALVCPCGCGDLIQLNLLEGAEPRWKLIFHPDGAVSCWPSIWRRHGCGSHFLVIKSRIEWFKDNGRVYASQRVALLGGTNEDGR